MSRSLRDWLDQIQGNHPDSIELGLDRVTRVWKRMGCPRPAPRVITVAGTNGKGSTVAGIEAGLLHLGRKVGCYTSPHLVHYNERIRINGRNADEATIIDGFEQVSEAQGDTRLTYFEFATLAAFATMANAGLDVAVLEIGLGGRLDAVNVIDAEVGVITTIGIDHQEFLGADRESIGREKAGIMRQDQVVICSDREPPISIFDAAEILNSKLIRIGADYEVSREPADVDPGQWRYFYADESVEFPVRPNLAHLADNLAGALTAIIKAEPDARQQLEKLARAVAATRVTGRLQQILSAPDVFLDVGHNPLAAGAVRDFLRRDDRTGCLAVIAMLDDKDAEGVAAVMGEQVSSWYCAGLDVARGQSGEKLAGRIQAVLPGSMVETHEDVAAAIESAMQNANSDDTVLVFGSFLTIEQAMKYFEC